MRTYVAVIAAFVLAIAGWAETPVAGTVDGKWTKDGSPYRVTGDLRVARGSTLWIEPDVDVLFSGPYALVVEGKLVAGRKKQKLPVKWDFDWRTKEPMSVRFTTDLERNPAGWRGIRFLNASSENELVNVEIANARSEENGGGLYCEQSGVSLVNCRISDCTTAGSGGAIAVQKGSVALTNGHLIGNRANGLGGGVYVMHGEMAITNATIALNSGGGVHLWRSEAVMTNCELKGNSGAAVTLLDKSEAVLTNCTIEDHTGAGIVCRESQFVGTNTVIDTDTETAASFLDGSEAVLTNATLRGGKGLDTDESSAVVSTNVTYGKKKAR